MIAFRMVVLIALMLTSFSAFAKDKTSKSGKPTLEEMTMTTYKADPDAKAVVLWSYTDVSFDIDATYDHIIYHNRVRVKILDEEGLSAASISIPYYDIETTNAMEGEVIDVTATTYNLENGKTVATKMPGNAVKKEHVGLDHFQVSFTAPDVKVGSVVEYEYKVKSIYYLTPKTWYAQCEYPVAQAVYDFNMPEWFHYSSHVAGGLVMIPEKKFGTYKSQDENFHVRVATERYIFIAAFLPALKLNGRPIESVDECVRVEHDIKGVRAPMDIYGHFKHHWVDIEHQGNQFFFNDEVGMHHFKYRLQDYFPGGIQHSVGTAINMSFNDSWYNIVTGLLKDSDFGKLYNMTNPLSSELSNINLSGKTLNDKVDALRNLLLGKYQWNGEYGILGKSRLFGERTLDMGTMNFLMMSMLREAGITATPVIFSRRSKGLFPDYPSTRYLNAMCLRIKDVDGSVLYFDPTTTHAVGSLPEELMFNKGIAVYPVGLSFVTTESAEEEKIEESIPDL